MTYPVKVPSTPEDSSIGVLDAGITEFAQSDIDLSEVAQVMHGTTVATNVVLTGKEQSGFNHNKRLPTGSSSGEIILSWRIRRVGKLRVKAPLLAPLELTIEADERAGADGESVSSLDEDSLKSDFEKTQF